MGKTGREGHLNRVYSSKNFVLLPVHNIFSDQHIHVQVNNINRMICSTGCSEL